MLSLKNMKPEGNVKQIYNKNPNILTHGILQKIQYNNQNN